MNFTETLKDLMIDKNITIKELAEATNINISSIYFYFKHNTIPDLNSAIKLSEFFNCSINYLLGLDDERKFKLKPSNKKFIEIYEALLAENNVKNYKVCKELNINRNSIYTWKKGKIPKMGNLIELAKYFDVSVDFLIGRTDKK